MKKKESVPDLAGLADAFLQAFKDTKDSGNLVNRQTISQFLLKQKDVRDLLRLAKQGRVSQATPEAESPEPVSPGLPELLNSGDGPVILDIAELQNRFTQECEFHARLTVFLTNLCKVPENEFLFPFLEQFTRLVAENASIEERKNLFNTLFDQLRQRKLQGPRTDSADRGNRIQSSPVQSPEELLDSIKESLLQALNDLHRILGNRCHQKIGAVTKKIESCSDVESLLLLRDNVLGIIEYYIALMNSERIKVADFIKDIGKKLITVENDLAHTFLDASQTLNEDTAFNAKLNDEIRDFADKVQGSNDLNELKVMIASRLFSLTVKLEQKQQDYSARLEVLTREKEKVQVNMQQMINSVLDQNKFLMEQSQKDPLTGILNRGTFEDTFNLELERYHRYREPFGLIMFDLDHFKGVNDTYGHEAGDRVLIGVVKSVSRILRSTDVFARFGGEEFVVMMPYSDYSHGIVVAEKIRKTIEETQFLYENATVPITVSVGLTVANLGDSNFNSMYRRVDQLLYEAKKLGKNRVVSDILPQSQVSSD